MKVINSSQKKYSESYMIYRWTIFFRSAITRYCGVWDRKTWETNIKIMMNGLVHQDGLIWWGNLDVSDHLISFQFVAKRKKAFVEIVV
jgi:hypothetical protein